MAKVDRNLVGRLNASPIRQADRKAAIQTELKDCWRRLSGGAGDAEIAYRLGILDGLRMVGAITSIDAELWEIRLAHCPGHEGGQTWCAYCGDVCRYCDGPGICAKPECVRLEHEEMGGSNCPWCGDPRPCLRPACMERKAKAGYTDPGLCPECGNLLPCTSRYCAGALAAKAGAGTSSPPQVHTTTTRTTFQPGEPCPKCGAPRPCANPACLLREAETDPKASRPADGRCPVCAGPLPCRNAACSECFL